MIHASRACLWHPHAWSIPAEETTVNCKALLLLVLFLAGCAGADADRSALAGQAPDDARMVAAHAHDTAAATPAATTPAAQPVSEERVAYGNVGGQQVFGYRAQPQRTKPGALPGLIVIHEWWGLNDNVRAEARRLAAEGYVTLAVDLYAGQTATEPPAAAKLAGELSRNPAPAEENLRQAYAYLDKTVRAPKIGTIGWCLGGRWSLRAATLLPEQVDATVIYYGTVTTPEADLARLQMPILGLFAANDRVIPVPTVKAFQDTLARLGKRIDVKIYEGTDHAFANPSGTAYEPTAAEDAWRRTLSFLRANLS
jgi:carboxymethylenebutenolidase